MTLPVAIAKIELDITIASEEFNRLNGSRASQGFWRELPADVERLICLYAERLSAMRRIKDYLKAQQAIRK